MSEDIVKAENDFNRKMTSFLLTLMEAINVQNKTRIFDGKKPSRVLQRWYDELSEMWDQYGSVR